MLPLWIYKDELKKKNIGKRQGPGPSSKQHRSDLIHGAEAKVGSPHGPKHIFGIGGARVCPVTQREGIKLKNRKEMGRADLCGCRYGIPGNRIGSEDSSSL